MTAPDVDWPLARRLSRAIADPGTITPRGDNFTEPIVSWQVRAVMLDLGIEEVGIDYCRVHAGTRNEDDSAENCDWFGRYDEDDERPCDFTPLIAFGTARP